MSQYSVIYFGKDRWVTSQYYELLMGFPKISQFITSAASFIITEPVLLNCTITGKSSNRSKNKKNRNESDELKHLDPDLLAHMRESGSEVLLRNDNSKDAKNSEEESEPETDDPNKLYEKAEFENEEAEFENEKAEFENEEAEFENEKAEFENEEADIENRRAAVRDGVTDDEDDEDGIEEGALIIDEDKVDSSAENDSDVEREIDDESATE
ncbi:hypothetical protein KQX54_001425 [Cotesia glomerata]|uniref:Uncharacterized protein n=1 Tax=Cotesia glomerata TaxID=32391 RepID=A0AAV7IL80_COTGL|nr:hypothetical protein KQX54_001425 [Cotesia glomerata]